MIGRLLATLAIALVGLLVGAASSAAATTTWTFGYTGGPQVFTVPAEVHQLSMLVVGGAGER